MTKFGQDLLQSLEDALAYELGDKSRGRSQYVAVDSEGNIIRSNTATVGEGVKFERIRRITGYLVGTLDRWNDGKTAEEKDRIKHGLPESCSACEE